MDAELAPPKSYQEDMSGNLGVPKGPPKWSPLRLYFMRQHGPSWGLRFMAPNRFSTIWGRASWSRIWAGLQNRYCHFREHSVETERSFFWKIHFGRGVHVEANLRPLKAAFPQKLPFCMRGPSKKSNFMKRSSPASQPGWRPAQPATPQNSIFNDFRIIFGKIFGRIFS